MNQLPAPARWLPATSRRWVAAACVVVCLAGCTSSSSAPIRKLSQDGTTLAATVSATNDAITISYSVTNEGGEPVIVVNGIPTSDTTNLPSPDENAVYITLRPNRVLEVSRRSFDQDLTADTQPYLLLGTELAAGNTLREGFQLTAPLETYQPGEPAKTLKDGYWESIVFCVGVVSPSRLDADLQSNTTPDKPVVHHGITQNVLCTEPTAK